jgi:hypothetical protein
MLFVRGEVLPSSALYSALSIQKVTRSSSSHRKRLRDRPASGSLEVRSSNLSCAKRIGDAQGLDYIGLLPSRDRRTRMQKFRYEQVQIQILRRLESARLEIHTHSGFRWKHLLTHLNSTDAASKAQITAICSAGLMVAVEVLRRCGGMSQYTSSTYRPWAS